MSAPGGSGRGGFGQGGWLLGGCLLRGGSQHALRQTPPVNRMTDRCKNITLATTSLRPVIKVFLSVDKQEFTKGSLSFCIPGNLDMNGMNSPTIVM